MNKRITVSDYCSQCQEVTDQFRRQFCGGSNWHCKQCGKIMDTVFDDDSYRFLADEAAEEGGK